jgi:hypothetical protein
MTSPSDSSKGFNEGQDGEIKLQDVPVYTPYSQPGQTSIHAILSCQVLQADCQDERGKNYKENFSSSSSLEEDLRTRPMSISNLLADARIVFAPLGVLSSAAGLRLYHHCAVRDPAVNWAYAHGAHLRNHGALRLGDITDGICDRPCTRAVSEASSDPFPGQAQTVLLKPVRNA